MRSKLARRASAACAGSKLVWENASLAHFVSSRKGQVSIASDLLMPCKLRCIVHQRGSTGINPSIRAQNFRGCSRCHRDRSDWSRTAQLVLPRIRPTSVQHRLNFLEAVDTHSCPDRATWPATCMRFVQPTHAADSPLRPYHWPVLQLCDGSSRRHISQPPPQASRDIYRIFSRGTARAIGRLGPDGTVDQWQWRRAIIAMEW